MVTARLSSIEMEDLNSTKTSTATIKSIKSMDDLLFNPQLPFLFFSQNILFIFCEEKKLSSLSCLLKAFSSMRYLY